MSTEEIQNNFYSWFLKTYNTEPECIYINLLLFPIELFQKEREEELFSQLTEYLRFYTKEELQERFEVIRTYFKSLKF
jgi:hypothetical protein